MSAAETGIFGSFVASARNAAVSSAGAVRLTGSDSPPCGGTRSAMVQCAPRVLRKSDVIHVRVLCAGEIGQFRKADVLEMFLFQPVGLLPDVAQDMPARGGICFV